MSILLNHFQKSNWKPNSEFPSYYLMALYESGGDFETYRTQLGYSNYQNFVMDLDALDGLSQDNPLILHTSYGRTWQSSLIKSTEYTPDTKELCIVFSNDTPYVYKDVTESEYEEFCKAESQGSYFIKTFRGKKEFTKIEITDENRDQ